LIAISIPSGVQLAAEKLALCNRAWLQPCRKQPVQIPALAAAKLQMAENKTAGAKARQFMVAYFGTTEVVPCYKTFPESSFPTA
jgi:hypothetical protein